MVDTIPGRAVIVGGGIAGLITARVLSEHFADVVVIERDALEDTGDPRKGAPQGRHLHALLKKGEELVSGLFPDLVEALVADGATPIDIGREVRWYHWGTWKANFAGSELVAISLSRPLLERHLRRRVLALPNVHGLGRHAVVGLVGGEDGRSVAGACVKPRGGGPASVVAADLVVDACGRGSRTPRWLEALGYSGLQKSSVRVDVKYATRIYRRPRGTLAWKLLYVMHRPPASSRLGVVAPIEGNRWIATLMGMAGDHPPDDDTGFLEFARSLPVPDVYCALASAEPVGDIASYRFPAHKRFHYERMRPFPDRFVVLGDSACSFSPVYAQGMTTAALGAVALGRCLADQRRRRGHDLTGLSHRFRVELARLIDDPWNTATGEDLRHPSVRGKRSLARRLLDPYVARVHKVSGHDPHVVRSFYRTMQMLDRPAALLRPDIVLRVLRG